MGGSAGRPDLIEVIDGIVWEAVPEPLHFTFVSRQSERILGYPAEAWIDDPGFWLAHVHPEDREWVPAYCREATAAKRSHAFEYRMIAADGRVVWIRDAVTVIVRDDEPVLLQGILTDVTASREAREELRRRNEDLETLHRLSSIPRQTATLREACDAFAATLGEAMGFPIVVIERLDEARRRMVPVGVHGVRRGDVASPDGNPVTDTLSGRAARVRKTVHLHRSRGLRELARDPLVRRGLQTLVVLPLDAGGRVIGSLAVGHPEVRPLEENRLRCLESLASYVATALDRMEGEEVLRGAYLALDRTADAAYLVDEKARFRYANEAACRAVGYTRDELLAGGVPLLQTAFTPEYWQNRWRDCREKGAFTFETAHTRKDGTSFPVEISVNYFEVGGQGYVCAIARDITL